MTNLEAIETIKSHMRKVEWHYIEQQAFNIAIRALEQTNDSLVGKEWIPVYTPPHESGSYLVSVDIDGPEEMREPIVLTAYYDERNEPFGNKCWSLLNEFYSLSDELRSNITHWRKWPEPPKEG